MGFDIIFSVLVIVLIGILLAIFFLKDSQSTRKLAQFEKVIEDLMRQVYELEMVVDSLKDKKEDKLRQMVNESTRQVQSPIKIQQFKGFDAMSLPTTIKEEIIKLSSQQKMPEVIAETLGVDLEAVNEILNLYYS